MSSQLVKLLIATALLAACAGEPAGLSVSTLPNASLGAPARSPSLVGVIIAIESGPRVLLEHRPLRPACQRHARASVGAETRVVWRDGRAGSIGDMRAGQRITAWFGDVELRSCPVQVYATTIVLEP
ncbi:MAG: hypothetical protein V4617_10155 [Gemmatimonadota bacterium]